MSEQQIWKLVCSTMNPCLLVVYNLIKTHFRGFEWFKSFTQISGYNVSCIIRKKSNFLQKGNIFYNLPVMQLQFLLNPVSQNTCRRDIMHFFPFFLAFTLYIAFVLCSIKPLYPLCALYTARLNLSLLNKFTFK